MKRKPGRKAHGSASKFKEGISDLDTKTTMSLPPWVKGQDGLGEVSLAV